MSHRRVCTCCPGRSLHTNSIDYQLGAQNLDGDPNVQQDDQRDSSQQRSSNDQQHGEFGCKNSQQENIGHLTNNDRSMISSQQARQKLQQLASNPNANPLGLAKETKSQELYRAYSHGGVPQRPPVPVFSPNDPPIQGEKNTDPGTLAHSHQHMIMTGGIHAASATIRSSPPGSFQNQELRRFSITLNIDPKYHPNIIGRKEATINKIRDDHGVRIQLPDKESSNSDEIIVTGYKHQVNSAQEDIFKIVRELELVPITEEMCIPFEFHRFIVGQRIRGLMEDHNVNIVVPSAEKNSEVVLITGPAKNCIEARVSLEKMVQQLEAEKENRELHSVSITLNIDPKYHPNIIGRKGATINKICDDRGVRIQMPDKESSNSDEIVVTGCEHQVRSAQEDILKIVRELEMKHLNETQRKLAQGTVTATADQARKVTVSTESPQQDKSMLERVTSRVTNALFSSPTKDWKRLYEQERKDRDKERKKYEEEKKRHEEEKNKVLQQYEYERAQYERNQKILEQEVERMRILHHKEKKKSDGLRKMILETREGGFSTTEPPYDDIATKYESLFGATANAVVSAYCPENATKEDKKAHKKKWMNRLSCAFQDTYKRNKASLFDQAFSEIFTPKQAMQPGYDPDLTKTEVDEYGHLLQVFLKKYPNGHPDKKVSQIVTRYQDRTRMELSPHERDGSVKLEEFVREALRVCWDMLTVNPPMLLDTSETSLNEDTQHVQMYGVAKGMEDAVENYSTECAVEFYKPVLYNNFLRDLPIRKGWTGIG